jgi:hypothetical protein
VTVTITAPLACAGVVATISVALATLTFVAATPPNVTVAPAAKRVPPRVTVVAPNVSPADGVIWVTVGGTTHCPCPLAVVGVDRLVVVPSPS